ncbi:MAG: tetratricopeptide repeat protein [Bacteroidaceae bacterium]
MKKILFLVVSFICSLAVGAQDSLNIDSVVSDSINSTNITPKTFSTIVIENATKGEADSAYIRNDYASAIQLYESLLKKGESADIYYNLGNSYFKAESIAKAILNYERALLLKPGDSDIRFNLELAQSKTVDKVDSIPQFFLVTWIQSLINSMGVDAWATLGIVCFILMIGFLFLFIFTNKVIIKKIGFITCLLMLVFVVVSNSFASIQKDALLNRTSAIVISPSVTIKSTPNESGTDLFILHEGRKVSVTDNSMKEWKEIKLEDGNIGWISTDDIEII